VGSDTISGGQGNYQVERNKILINHTGSCKSSWILTKLFDKVLNKWNHFVLQRYMGNLIQNRQRVSTTRINERCICKADNITIVPMYHTRDSLSYQVSRCNYCREEWAEYWISYRYIFSPLIYQHQQKGG
jgi:hypothetical protein